MKTITISLTPLVVAALYFGAGLMWPVWIYATLAWIVIGGISAVVAVMTIIGERAQALEALGKRELSLHNWLVILVLAMLSVFIFWHAAFTITAVTYGLAFVALSANRLHYMIEQESY